MGAINFGNLINGSNLGLVNEPATTSEDDELLCSIEYNKVEEELSHQNFYYFNVYTKIGYYEGFYLVLTEENTTNLYNDCKEKAEVLKELTQIKKLLIKFVKKGLLIGCYPSWSPTYPSTAETIIGR